MLKLPDPGPLLAASIGMGAEISMLLPLLLGPQLCFLLPPSSAPEDELPMLLPQLCLRSDPK